MDGPSGIVGELFLHSYVPVVESYSNKQPVRSCVYVTGALKFCAVGLVSKIKSTVLTSTPYFVGTGFSFAYTPYGEDSGVRVPVHSKAAPAAAWKTAHMVVSLKRE